MKLLEKLDSLKHDEVDAYIHNEEHLTYKELHDKSDRLAHYLNERLKDDKTPIPVYGHKEAMMLVCFLACVKSGRAYCPIDSGMPENRTQAILQAVDSSIVLCCRELASSMPSLVQREEIKHIIETHDASIEPSCYVKEEDTFYIIFTSGSTGVPKGVQIAYNNLNHFLEWSIPLANAAQGKKVFINQAPFSFDLSVMDVYTALGSGSTIFALDKDVQKDYHRLFEALKASHANVWVSTPSFADMCLADHAFSKKLMPELQKFLFCGEILTNDTARKLIERFDADVINTYGPTESTVAVSDVQIIEEIVQKENPLPIGKPKPGTWIEIVDETGECLPDMEKGEIVIIGNTVGQGYFHQLENTKKAFFTKNILGAFYPAYHTGDKGYMKDGMLYYSGRMDLQVKLNGYRIEIADIEQNLMKVEKVKNVVILPHYKAGKIKNLVAFVVYDGDTSQRFQLGQSISASLKQFLPDYMIPKKYIFIEEIPMTNNGKIDRKALQEVLS